MAWDVVRFLIDAYGLEGVVADPDDDDVFGLAVRHLAESQRLIEGEVRAWDRVVARSADKGGAVPF